MSVQASCSRFMTTATRGCQPRPSQVALSVSQIPHTQNATVNDQENLMSEDHGSVIHYEAGQHVARITLNRPGKLNAL